VREAQVRQYLLTQGYTIVAHNYHTKCGEIDCIAVDPDGTLVFCEVKSSWGFGCGDPLYWVNERKRRVLVRMARQYLYERGMHTKACRFDVIAISSHGIDHLRNAFLLSC
jgi:putative endonuclease